MEGECRAHAALVAEANVAFETFPGRPFRRGVSRARRPRLRTHRPRGCERRGTRANARGRFQRGVRSKRDGPPQTRSSRRWPPPRREASSASSTTPSRTRWRVSANRASPRGRERRPRHRLAVAAATKPRRSGWRTRRTRANRARPRRTRNRRRSSFGRDDVRGRDAGPKRAGPPARVGDGLGGGTREGDGPERGDAEEDFEDVGVEIGVDRRRARLGPDARSSSETAAGTIPEGDARLARLRRVSRRTRCSKARNVARFAPPSPRWNCASCLRAAVISRGPTRRLSVRRRSRRVGRHRAGSRGGSPRGATRARVDRSWVTWR